MQNTCWESYRIICLKKTLKKTLKSTEKNINSTFYLYDNVKIVKPHLYQDLDLAAHKNHVTQTNIQKFDLKIVYCNFVVHAQQNYSCVQLIWCDKKKLIWSFNNRYK